MLLCQGKIELASLRAHGCLRISWQEERTLFAPQRLALAGHEALTAECVHPLPRGGSAWELPWPRSEGMEPDVRERKGPKTRWG